MSIMFNILGCFVGMLLYFAIMNCMNWINSKKQHVFIFCPVCETELIKNGELIKDEGDIVTYKCPKCGDESRWDVVHYPCPMWLGDDLINY